MVDNVIYPKLYIMQALTFEAQALKIERTHSFSGKVIFATDYVSKDKKIPGVELQVEGCPYPLRVLLGSIKGANSASTLLNCDVNLTGIMREHEGKQYFNPKDCTVTRRSGIATLAATGVAFAGSLD